MTTGPRDRRNEHSEHATSWPAAAPKGLDDRLAKSELLDLPTPREFLAVYPPSFITRELPLESEGMRERHRHIPGPSTTRPSTHCRRRR
jgi:hypothetical protein